MPNWYSRLTRSHRSASRAVVDRVRDGTGVAAFISSGLGSVADKTDSYSASKAALNWLSRSYRGRDVAC